MVYGREAACPFLDGFWPWSGHGVHFGHEFWKEAEKVSVFDIILGDKMSIFDHEVATVSILDMIFEAKQTRCPFLTLFWEIRCPFFIAKWPRCPFWHDFVSEPHKMSIFDMI